MSLSVEKLGFGRSTLGHKIVTVNEDPNRNYGGRQHIEAICSCGFIASGYVTKAGHASGWATRYWNDHVDGMASPDEIYTVGVIHKKRVRWDVFVVSRNYSGADDYEWRWGGGPHGEVKWYEYSHWACVVHKSNGERVLSRAARTKDQAIDQGRKLLSGAERQGHKVEWGADAEPEAPTITPKASLVAFVERVDDALTARKLVDAKGTLDLLDEYLVSVPILQAKRAALADHVMELMTLGMDVGLNDDQAEENETEV